jgi:hypothetical protein
MYFPRLNPTERAGAPKSTIFETGEAMSALFDGKVINPYGVVIDLPHWVFVRLKRFRLLEREIETGMHRIKKQIFGLMALWEGPDFRPGRGCRAFDPSYQRACPRDSGYAGAFLKALGSDCSGLVNPAIEQTRRLESDLGHSRLSDEYRRATVEEALRAVREKRARAA